MSEEFVLRLSSSNNIGAKLKSYRKKRVTIVILSNCSLISVPKELLEFEDIKILDLSNNSIKVIPDTFYELFSGLQVLRLDHNPLLYPPQSVAFDGLEKILEFYQGKMPDKPTFAQLEVFRKFATNEAILKRDQVLRTRSLDRPGSEEIITMHELIMMKKYTDSEVLSHGVASRIAVYEGRLHTQPLDIIIHDNRIDLQTRELQKKVRQGNLLELGGKALVDEFNNIKPFFTGSPLITTGGTLKAQFICHISISSEKEIATLLSRAFEVCANFGMKTIGLSPFRTNLVKKTISIENIARYISEAVVQWLATNKNWKRIDRINVITDPESSYEYRLVYTGIASSIHRL